MDTLIIFHLLVLILSIIIHEVSHGYAALALGDPTAKYQGRLTLNPIKHIDPVGSLLVPALLVLTGSSFLFGWAKPVPYNPYNLRNQRWGEALVAGAGPGVNILIAIAFGIVVHLSLGTLSLTFVTLIANIVYINLLLALFNLIPIPPLDGSRILKALLPYRMQFAYEKLEGKLFSMGPLVGFIILFVIVSLLWPLMSPVLSYLFSILT
jgi:Zn-dependent protease